MAGEVTFQPTEADFVLANRQSLNRALLKPRTFIGIGLIAAGLAWFQFLFHWLGSGDALVLLAALLGAALAGAGYLAAYPVNAHRTRRLFRQQATLRHRYSYRWDEQGLGISSSFGTGTIPWSDFHRWSDGGGVTLFFLNDQLFYFLPHRVLDAAQIEDLRATAAAQGLKPC